ncbi:MAG TPA: lactonase family protein [Candidatus Latescibacteria bacterium]|nr:lactonase family protein [Candidatus Latescibacterota bacterium]
MVVDPPVHRRCTDGWRVESSEIDPDYPATLLCSGNAITLSFRTGNDPRIEGSDGGKSLGHYVYIPIGGENTIQIHELDPASGALTLRHELTLPTCGRALCTDPGLNCLYVALHDDESNTAVVTCRIDAEDGGLTPIAEVDLEGHKSCYLSTDRSGRFLLSAYYSDGLVTVHPIGDDGAAHGPPADRVVTERYAHWVATDRANRYAFVPHVQSANRIYQFRFDAAVGKLTANAVSSVGAGPGQGPRHLAYHPVLDVVYADNEQECSVTVYHLDTAAGTLSAVQTVSTLPEAGFDGEKSNAQLHIHPDGRAVYASNRGPDSIAMFAIDPSSGAITSLGQQPAQKIPRSFGIDPDGDFLISGADESNILTTFRIDRRGDLEPVAEYDIGGPSAWVLPVKLG